ncbi:kinase-like domain-containing protein [Calycina marina]|uniref:Kinase-like domain-containing protein n=1 Tax=Calycina marina TaxID=1763456 RepID=A0A9P7Z5V1_9HELO|nr:kinase-like domain-containing protein [Calycina marina]
MATASPTPMGSSHFSNLNRRPSSSRLSYKQPLNRPHVGRAEPYVPEPPTRHYTREDSSDDEIPLPMKFSALTKALLNDEASVADQSPQKAVVTKRQPHKRPKRSNSLDSLMIIRQEAGIALSSPHLLDRSPLPAKRVVRLSQPSGMRRTSSLSKDIQEKDIYEVKADSPHDIATPAPVKRTVKVGVVRSGVHGQSSGSSGRNTLSTNSGGRQGEAEAPENPSTVARSQLATSQGSVSRLGASTVGRNRFGEEAGLQSSMRLKRVGKVAGSFLSGPARRGRRRMDDEEQSPVEEHGDGLDSAGASQEQQSREPRVQVSREKERYSSQEPESVRPPIQTAYRDFASGSPIAVRDSKDILDSIMRSNSPPPPTLSSSQRSSAARHNTQPPQPVYRIPPKPNLPSTHDQENEAPPTFKRNKPAPVILIDKQEQIKVQRADVLQSSEVSPARCALAPRSLNTPRRPAPPPPKMSLLEAATSNAGAATTANAAGKRNVLKLNGKKYTRLDCIGRGGSSKVYRVMAENSKFFALKRVSFDDADESAVMGFKGEIDLLRKLEGVDRVIRLYDWELNEEKGTLSVLMEMGELDMNTMLGLRLKNDQAKFDPSFVRHYWKEMLECLQAIHEHDIVHSDLKPHNFVLCQGTLKLIDFGIANAIQTDETVNVHREAQIGTPNYMSPESLMDTNAGPDSRGRVKNEARLMKIGKPSDIWSLACILYQMVYGRAPFAHIQNQMQRCQAIINWTYAIEYPALGIGNIPVPLALIGTLKRCLSRDQHLRPTATELLNEKDPFLNPAEFSDEAFPMTEELLGRILQNVAAKCATHMPSDSELLIAWPKGYLNNLRQKLKDGRPL